MKNINVSIHVLTGAVLSIFGLIGLFIIFTASVTSGLVNSLWFLSAAWLIAGLLITTHFYKEIAGVRIFSTARFYPVVLLVFCYFVTWSCFLILSYTRSIWATLCIYLVAIFFALYSKFSSSPHFKRRFAFDACFVIFLLALLTMLNIKFSSFNTFLSMANTTPILIYMISLAILLIIFSSVTTLNPRPTNIIWTVIVSISIVSLLLFILSALPLFFSLRNAYLTQTIGLGFLVNFTVMMVTGFSLLILMLTFVAQHTQPEWKSITKKFGF